MTPFEKIQLKFMRVVLRCLWVMTMTARYKGYTNTDLNDKIDNIIDETSTLFGELNRL